MQIPFHRPSLDEAEINEVVDTLKSGWLTTGPKTRRFETEFAQFVGAKHAIALNSATAALHLALDAVGLQRGEAVLVPTMTFAATAEVVRYFDAVPVLVDCRDSDLNLCPIDLRRRIAEAKAKGLRLRALIPVHYAGRLCDMDEIAAIAREHDLALIEDAAHCCPAHLRTASDQPWKSVGTWSTVTCYSFYANKCITTGEGGMACTNDDAVAERIRIMSLHGISKDAWKRFTSEGSWYYEIVAPGFKYNLTDIASCLGLHQLRKAEAFRAAREAVALQYNQRLQGHASFTVPEISPLHRPSYHLYSLRLNLETLRVDHGPIIADLKQAGIGASVHWMPLHMHPYYRTTYGYAPSDLPVAAAQFPRLISLPIFPGLTEAEIDYVCSTLIEACRRQAR